MPEGRCAGPRRRRLGRLWAAVPGTVGALCCLTAGTRGRGGASSPGIQAVGGLASDPQVRRRAGGWWRGGSRRCRIGADAVADLFGDEAGFACPVEADLLGDLVGGDQIFAFRVIPVIRPRWSPAASISRYAIVRRSSSCAEASASRRVFSQVSSPRWYLRRSTGSGPDLGPPGRSGAVGGRG